MHSWTMLQGVLVQLAVMGTSGTEGKLLHPNPTMLVSSDEDDKQWIFLDFRIPYLLWLAVVATYSGSADGIYLPAQAIAPLTIYDTCDKYGKLTMNSGRYEGSSNAYGSRGGVLGAILGQDGSAGDDIANEGGSQLPVYGNGYGGKYPDGHYYPPGVLLLHATWVAASVTQLLGQCCAHERLPAQLLDKFNLCSGEYCSWSGSSCE